MDEPGSGAPVLVDDPADPRVRDYFGLTDLARRSRVEPAAGLFLAEGDLVIRRALAAGYRMRSALLAPDRLAGLADVLVPDGAPVYLAAPEMLRTLTGFDVHRGSLAAFDRRPERTVPEVLAGARLVAVLEGLNNPTNIGTVFRSAAALGVDAVLLDPSCYDPLYRRAVRVSMAATLLLPYARLAPWPAGLAQLSDAGFALLACTPDPAAVALPQLSPTGPVAVLLGAEGPGLSRAALAAATARVRIPMSGGVDSLNVAAAGAVVFYALGVLQDGRNGPGGGEYS